jgi:spore coat-associated protein N
MQRLGAVWHASPRKLMGALLMLLLAAGMAVGSGASFTSSTASPGNVIATGALAVNNDRKSNGIEGAILTVANVKPGDAVTGTVTVSNTGTVPGVFDVSMGAPVTGGSGANLADRLKLRIQSLDGSGTVTGTVLADTLISAVTTTPLGTWAGNSNHSYRCTVIWPSGLSGDNAYQASTLTLDFTWSTTQA